MMDAFIGNIEQLTLENTNFRTVIYTGPHLQLVLMSLQPNEEIGLEIHDKEDQFIRIEQGSARVVINGTEQILSDDMAVVVPAGAEHNIINASTTDPLKLYTIYCEKHHADGTIHATKQEADEAEALEHQH